MEFLYITEYLESTESPRWNLLGALQYVSSKIDYTSKDADSIFENFKQRLECRSKDPSVFKSAQNRARKLSQQLDITQPEIIEFLEHQDSIIAQVSHTNLFLIFINKAN